MIIMKMVATRNTFMIGRRYTMQSIKSAAVSHVSVLRAQGRCSKHEKENNYCGGVNGIQGDYDQPVFLKLYLNVVDTSFSC